MLNPFKNRRQNVHELLVLLNLLILFAIAQYTATNSIGIQILISFAILQFTIISLNHVRLYSFSKFSNSSLNVKISKIVTKLETVLLGYETAASTEGHEMQSIGIVNIYNEFREPLIREFDT